MYHGHVAFARDLCVDAARVSTRDGLSQTRDRKTGTDCVLNGDRENASARRSRELTIALVRFRKDLGHVEL